MVGGTVSHLLLLRVAMGTDGVYLVDEDDARRTLLRRGEELAHALRSDAHEDLRVGTARHAPRMSAPSIAEYRRHVRQPAAWARGSGRGVLRSGAS